jgi:hypothetical protein
MEHDPRGLVPAGPAAAAHGTPLDSASPSPYGPAPLLDPARQAVFCEALSRHGNVRAACAACGVSAQTAYRMRRAAPAFAAMWQAAQLVARAHVEDVLADRALNGVEEAVFYHGEEVARRRRFDTRLLLAHLARLDKLAEHAGHARLADQFDAGLAQLAAGAGAGGLLPVGRAPDCADLWDDDADMVPDPDDVPLLEAQLRWLEAQYGDLSAEDEAFHLLHTVPGVPSAALAAFGWVGDGAEDAAGDAAGDLAAA